jgi:hypothetical protein
MADAITLNLLFKDRAIFVWKMQPETMQLKTITYNNPLEPYSGDATETMPIRAWGSVLMSSYWTTIES